MEKCLKLLLLLSLFPLALMGQKMGYVDTEYILNKHPDYKKIQGEIEALSNEWKKEAQNLEEEINEMYSDLQGEQVLLTEEMYQERLKLIREKQKAATAFNNRIFGPNGQLYQKQSELLQPLQSKIFDAIDRVSKRNSLAILFDKASSPTSIIYTDPRHDYSEFIIEELGLEENNQN